MRVRKATVALWLVAALEVVAIVLLLQRPAAYSSDPLPLDTTHIDDLRPTTPQPEVIQEDDPRWDCRTMGNRRCGPAN